MRELAHFLPQLNLYRDSGEIISSPLYLQAYRVFQFLTTSRLENGCIFDKNSDSCCDDHYQNTFYALSALILDAIHEQDTWQDHAFATFQYYFSIPPEQSGHLDFNNLAVLLAYGLMTPEERQDPLGGLLLDRIQTMQHHAAMEKAHGNNFITLRALNHLLRYQIVKDPLDLELSDVHMGSTLKWQFQDGIFYDDPRDAHSPAGIPHLTYHAKMTLMTLLFGVIKGDPDIIQRALHGLSALASLVAGDGEVFYYGRSNNTVFGIACGVLAFRIAQQYSDDCELVATFQACERKLIQFCSWQVADDGHLYIAANCLEKQRCGFDSYMRVAVYNAYAMALFLLAALIVKKQLPGKNIVEDQVIHLPDSGFVIKNGRQASICLNAKGHNCRGSRLFDPRLTGGSPLFLKFQGVDLLPSIPFDQTGASRTENRSLWAKIKRKFNALISNKDHWHFLEKHNPLLAGFLPYLQSRHKLYLPIYHETVTMYEAEDPLTITLRGKMVETIYCGAYPLLASVYEQLQNSLPLPNMDSRHALIQISDYEYERSIVIHKDVVHFTDTCRLPRIQKKGFTLRTFADWHYTRRRQADIFQNQDGGFVVFSDVPHLYQRFQQAGSSKGDVSCWKYAVRHTYAANGDDRIELNHAIWPFSDDDNIERKISEHEALMGKAIHGD
jgi:hypothetical protein